MNFFTNRSTTNHLILSSSESFTRLTMVIIMMIFMVIHSFFLTDILTAQSTNQTGILSGIVIDEQTGEELIGASIFIPDLASGGITDISGRYNIRVQPGNYTIEYSYVNYQKRIIEDVEIIAGEVTRLDISLLVLVGELDDVVISARRTNNNEVSLLRLQQKSLSVQDGISVEEMDRIGFGNSAESMRLVTGASIEDGKYVVMRGLGDRYSIASMDGISLPASNPYRNSASLDLIPTSMVDNVVVKKTFSPDLPGNFSGGAVDITTQSLPDQYYLTISSSVSYNDQTTFNKNFLADPINNKYRRLGYDDGSRARNSLWSDNEFLRSLDTYLIRVQNNLLSDAEIADFNQTMRSFSERGFNVQQSSPGLDHSLNVSVGNRYKRGEQQFGFNLGVNYSNSYVQYDERQLNNYLARIPEGNSPRMQTFQLNSGAQSSNDVSNGFIGTFTFQPQSNHEFTFTSVYSNSASETVIDMVDGSYPGALSSGTYNNRSISFMQRELINNQLKGRHFMDKLEINWAGSYVMSSQYEPNTRFIGSPVDAQGRYFYVREVQLPFHFFRDLEDTQINAKLDVEYKLTPILSVKSGGTFARKERSFNEFRYQLENNGTNPDFPEFLSFREASGDFESYFAPENTGVIGVDGNGNLILGLTYRDQTRPENSYTGSEQVSAGYFMAVWDATSRLKVFGGARMEHTDYLVESGTASATIGRGEINELDILPSANIIYALNDKSNLRLSASRTLARPNMREMAPFVSFDLLGGFPIVGNPNLKRTNITNLDFRYEIFPRGGELYAISLFYKDFQNPIVTELDVATDQPQYSYINTNSGRLLGIELEMRKDLDFISDLLTNYKFSANFTYTNSRVDLSQREVEVRRQLDPNIKDYRPFPYQSPYLFNLTVSYMNAAHGWDGAVYLNIFGPRLAANGSGAAPDIFEIYGRLGDDGRLKNDTPLPDLNLRVRKSFSNRFSTSLSVNNLLDYSVVQYQEDAGTFYTSSALNPGRTFTLSFSYNLN